MAATLTDLVDPAGEARRPMWGIGQASSTNRAAKSGASLRDGAEMVD
jgi:hypothetical protein